MMSPVRTGGPVVGVSHPDGSQSRDVDLSAPAGTAVGGSQHGHGSPAPTIAVVVGEHRHDVDEIFVTQRDDLVTDRLIVLAWIKDWPCCFPGVPPLVVRENHVGPRNAAVFRYDLPFVRSLGNTSRSHTA